MPAATAGSESLAPVELEKKLHGITSDEREESLGVKPVSKWLLLIVSIGMLCSGTFDSIIAKFMNKQEIPRGPGQKPANFEAPFLQTWTMYLGEFVLFIVYFGDEYIAKKRGVKPTFDIPASAKSFKKPHCPPWLWFIPMLIDFIASTMNNYATLFVQASTSQMLRNFNVVITAALTMLYLRKALRMHQAFGVVFITIGMVLTGLYGILNPDNSNPKYGDGKYASIGVMLAVAGTALSAFQFIFEEKLFRKYTCSPFEAVGWMGLYGSILGVVVLAIGEYAGFEDVSATIYQFRYGSAASHRLLIANISFVFSISIFNGCGLSVTKLASGLLRTMLQAGRTVLVWIVSIIIAYDSFAALQFSGLLVIVLAIFVYNYNYAFNPDSWSGDHFARKPLLCCCLVDPDAPSTEDLVTPEDIERLEREKAARNQDKYESTV